MVILSTGQKIKRLRKELGLKQDDITNNEEVTRSLISMVENNKRALSWSTANIIADCLNHYYKNIGKVITPEYLMESEAIQAKNIIISQMKIIESSIHNSSVSQYHLHQSIKWLMELAVEWELEKEMTELLALRGELYFHTQQYNEALKDYSEALEYNLRVSDYEQVARIYNLIGNSYHVLGLVDQALLYFTKSHEMTMNHNTSNKDTLKMYTIFNIIACYRKLKKYDMVFQYIKTFKELSYYNDSHYDQVLLMEASTYRDLLNYEKAERIYEKLLQRKERLEDNTLFLTYDNCVILYREKGLFEKALMYIEEALVLKDKIKIHHLPGLYKEQAKCYIQLNKFVEAIVALEKGLVIAQQLTIDDLSMDFNFAFAEVYIMMKDFDNAKQHLNQAEGLITSQNNTTKLMDLYSHYAELYFQEDEREKCLEYITKLQSSRTV